ncbi:MAG TPA: 50S ribosomal protein L11 methyltransferase [Gemmatimonadaceae bacterium]|nr:50S ribosomal protein L11 methyltransferase [Gemmatimonadaceae bacterium]
MSRTAGWVTVRVLPGAHGEEVAAALFAAGAPSLQELGDALITHVETQAAADRLVSAARAAHAEVAAETAPLPDVDWSKEWRRSMKAHRVGSLTIAPPWLATDLDPARSIVIEPGMAFGTGEHPTTRGVIRLLHSVVQRGDRVADLGAGSAVLAIAAAKLGAASVAAIEIDADAIGNAEENVRRNGVSDIVSVIEGDAATLLGLVAPVRVITANIISSVLVEMLPDLVLGLAPGGRVILAGILSSERDEMLASIEAQGWRAEADDVEEAWWSVTIARR